MEIRSLLLIISTIITTNIVQIKSTSFLLAAPLLPNNSKSRENDKITQHSYRHKRHNSASYTTDHNGPASSNSNRGYGPAILVSDDALLQTVELHKSHVIECVNEAEPPADIRWYHNNEPIEKDGHHHQALGSELVFLETKQYDQGSYQCRATNKFGSANSPTFTLTVSMPIKQFKQQPTTHVSNQPMPTVRLESIKAGRPNQPTEIICEAPDNKIIRWFVNGRPIEVQSLQANGDDNQASSDQYRFSQRMGKLFSENSREYILTIAHKQMIQYAQDQINLLNITCAYLYTNIAHSEWVQSDTCQLILSKLREHATLLTNAVGANEKNLSDLISLTNYSRAQNNTYRVPIEINMAPPMDNLVNTSASSSYDSSATSLETTTSNGTSLMFKDYILSLSPQQSIPIILILILVMIASIISMIYLSRLGILLLAHRRRAYKRDQKHHKSHHRYYQVAPPQSQYLPVHYPYLVHNNTQAHFISQQSKLSNHRLHDSSKSSQRSTKTWSLFGSSKKHTQLINPFLGVNPRQLSMVSKDGYPSLDGVSSELHLLPGMLHSSLSQNNFATAAAYPFNCIDMRSVTPQQGSKQCAPQQFFSHQQNRPRHLSTLTIDQPTNQAKSFANNNNQISLNLADSNVMYTDTPSIDGVTSMSPSSSPSTSGTQDNNSADNGYSKNCNQSMILTGKNIYLSRQVSNGAIESCDNIAVDHRGTYKCDKSASKSDIEHHYSTIAEFNRSCLDNEHIDACYEDLEQHQLALAASSRHQHLQHQQQNNQRQDRNQSLVDPSEPCPSNNNFMSRISSFLAHQNIHNNSKRGSGASSSLRSSASMTKSSQANLNKNDQFQQPSPYAIATIQGVTPTPPPPMSEAMKALNEQFNLDQLILFNGNGIDQGLKGKNNIK